MYVTRTEATANPQSFIEKTLQTIKVYTAVTKPRIMILLLFTAYCAMIVAQKGFPDIYITIFTLVGLALSSGGSAAINMWYDRDIDAVMQRTAKRPLPAGMADPRKVLWFGIVLEALSFFLLAFAVNWLTAVFSLAGFVYYVFIYTMWLKRTTPQNIVIGGGAGAFPPLVGWAAVTGSVGLIAIVMFIVVFLWTPPHFWALALYKNEDYTRAGIPMMPVVRGPRVTKRQSVIYAALLLLASISVYFTHDAGPIYLVTAGLLGIAFLIYNIMNYRERDDSFVWAKRTFRFSVMYLPALFVLMVFSMGH